MTNPSESVWTTETLTALGAKYDNNWNVSADDAMRSEPGELLLSREGNLRQVIRGKGDTMIMVDWGECVAYEIQPDECEDEICFNINKIEELDVDPTDPDDCIRVCKEIASWA